MLEIKNLAVSVRRGRNICTAVDGIDISLNAGETAALAGESGCGKTLTALSVMRLLHPAACISGGSIQWETPLAVTQAPVPPPRNGAAPPQHRPAPPIPNHINQINLSSLDEKSLCKIRGKEIAMIFQEPGQSLNPLMRTGAQIAEPLRLRGTDKKTAANSVLDLLQKLKFADPEKIFNSWPHRLSGGMCRRVMIAAGAVCRPRLLIADEPTASLDPETREHITDLLKQINREFGTAVLFITHDLESARKLCGRFLIMYGGKIVEKAPTGKLFASPAHPYTSGLIGAIPRRENRGKPLPDIPGKMPSVEERSPGCPFAPRCYKAKSPCRSVFPTETDLGNNHKVFCHFPGSVNG